MAGEENRRDDGRVRKRTSNACERCRRQKIKCSGTVPCEQCTRRSAPCTVHDRRDRVVVSQRYLAQLEQCAAGSSTLDQPILSARLVGPHAHTQSESRGGNDEIRSVSHDYAQERSPSHVASDDGTDHDEDSRSQSSAVPEADLTNPLDPSNCDPFTVNTTSTHYFLGLSSNWSFGRRVLALVHEHVNAEPLHAENLLFPGATYELGWDGHRSLQGIEGPSVPTVDFALFQINAVKFHCGRLFHIFDEPVFMKHFRKFYENPDDATGYPRLWFVHFLLILAFGKAFIARACRGKQPPGVEFYTHAMQILPEISRLYSDPVQAIEILSCAALYLQCIDRRSEAYNVIGQAMRIAIEQGMHTGLQSRHLPNDTVERYREVWWTVYVLDRHMTSTLGVPMGISDDDVTAPLPTFAGSLGKASAMRLLVKLSQATAVIVQTVYGKTGRRSDRFLNSIKEALKTIAEANDERVATFPLDLSKPSVSIDRVAAYLHMLHHMSLILATRPLLYSFLQMRLKARRPLRVSSSHGVRVMVRVCVKSAQQCLGILEILQSQALLESFLPYDRDAAFASAFALTIAEVVDRSLLRTGDSRSETVDILLNEMASRGNLLADFHRRELDLLKTDIQKLQEREAAVHDATRTGMSSDFGGNADIPTVSDQLQFDANMPDPFQHIETFLNGWDSDEELDREHLMAVADSLETEHLDWLAFASS